MSDDLRNRGDEAAPSKFTKKPVTIEAIQWTGGNAVEILTWMTGVTAHHDGSSLFIETLEGTHEAGLGDWIIKGVKGEFYPCKPDIFEATYSDAAIAELVNTNSEMDGVREEYCVKCGAPRSNHPYRHPFEARKSVQDFFLTEERKNDE